MECECPVAGFCARRQAVVALIHWRRCQAGECELIDKFTKKAAGRPGHISQPPVVEAAPLKFAEPSPTTTIGSQIRSMLEAAGHLDRLTGKCRGYLALLNEPQRLDAETVTDTLAELLQEESVQNVRQKQSLPVERAWLAEVVVQAIQADAESRPAKVDKVPAVSDVGTRLLSAIEFAGQYRLTCGTCRTRIRSFDNSLAADLDPDTVTDFILSDFQESAHIREHVGGRENQRVWLRAIVANVIESTGPS